MEAYCCETVFQYNKKNNMNVCVCVFFIVNFPWLRGVECFKVNIYFSLHTEHCEKNSYQLEYNHSHFISFDSPADRQFDIEILLIN